MILTKQQRELYEADSAVRAIRSSRKVSIDEAIDDVLVFMSLAMPADAKASMSASDFDGAFPLLAMNASGADDTAFEALRTSRLLATSAGWKPAQIFEHFDQIQQFCVSSAESVDGGAYELWRVRGVSPRAVRQHLTRRPRAAVEISCMTIEADGIASRPGTFFLGFDDRGWTDPHCDRLAENAEFIDVLREKLRLSYSLAAHSLLNWNVRIGYEGHPSVSFTTDHIGAREVFRLRDIPEGKSRRAALRHWVKSHWRSGSRDGSSEVRRHLRGAERFVWNGLRCVITPSIEDMEENERH